MARRDRPFTITSSYVTHLIASSAPESRNWELEKHLSMPPARVRVKGSLSSSAWGAGTAVILDDDDPKERVRILGRGNRWRRLCLEASASVATSPLTIRVDLDLQ